MVQGSREELWEGVLERWLEPFLAALGHKAQRRWAPVYLRGLLAPGERKSVEPIASRVAPGEVQQLHSVSGLPTAMGRGAPILVQAKLRQVLQRGVLRLGSIEIRARTVSFPTAEEQRCRG